MYLILWKSPKQMRIYKFLLLNISVWAFITDMLLEIISLPLPVLEVFGLYSVGLSRFLPSPVGFASVVATMFCIFEYLVGLMFAFYHRYYVLQDEVWAFITDMLLEIISLPLPVLEVFGLYSVGLSRSLPSPVGFASVVATMFCIFEYLVGLMFAFYHRYYVLQDEVSILGKTVSRGYLYLAMVFTAVIPPGTATLALGFSYIPFDDFKNQALRYVLKNLTKPGAVVGGCRILVDHRPECAALSSAMDEDVEGQMPLSSIEAVFRPDQCKEEAPVPACRHLDPSQWKSCLLSKSTGFCGTLLPPLTFMTVIC
ncbi:hypothetical protein QR680_015602 [Steinernema hermaphroditum]|uniref:Uncharacterized protein n=1 Tax=Steinernema hermaphroditum TaxID=289476 RepID=A0AA39HAJ9_9BILA|nr:hypothetical protein QR680_015602 [Steinernema hermaphroditum]